MVNKKSIFWLKNEKKEWNQSNMYQKAIKKLNKMNEI